MNDAEKLYCEVCNIHFDTKSKRKRHIGTKDHKDRRLIFDKAKDASNDNLSLAQKK